MADGPIVVHVFPGAWGLPTASPFCLKIETWLRMCDIPYRQQVVEGMPKSSTGKVPYIERPDGEFLPDSQAIIETLRQERGCSLDEHLDAGQRRDAHMMRRMVEKNLYFVLMWQRWFHEGHWPKTRAAYFAHVPGIARRLVGGLARRAVRKQIDGQGIGLQEPDEIYANGCADVDALSQLLGDKTYFFGEPSSADAVAYAVLQNIAEGPFDDPLTERVTSDDRLMAFCNQMTETYWAD